jgi:hypothetical protein
MIGHQLDGVRPDEQRILEAASVAGAEFSLLLATTRLGSSRDAERLRQVAGSCSDAALKHACTAVAGVLEDPATHAGSSVVLATAGGPVLGDLLQVQLTARIHERAPREFRTGPAGGPESASSS